MLERIFIKNFAIIDELAIDFQANFSVLTGETGAGKSIIIDAVSILLGARAQNEMIRFGTEKAYVEGVFTLDNQHEIMILLLEKGYVDLAEDQFVLSRELNCSGKNTCRINGRTVTLNIYRQIAIGLVDIHGQHDYQLLMQNHKQIGILDAYGGKSLIDLREKVKLKYQKWQALECKLKEAKNLQQERLIKQDFLQFQLEEIDQAKLIPNEIEELTSEIHRLANSERISQNLNLAYDQLFGLEEQASAFHKLGEALHHLKDLSKFDPELKRIFELLEPASYIFDEAAREISNYLENVEYNPSRLEEAENRLYLLKHLCKKYGETIAEIIILREKIAIELEELKNWQDQENNWEKELQILCGNYDELADQLHKKRIEISSQLAISIDQELKDLAMIAAHFIVDIKKKAASSTGTDAVEFLISSNTGEPFLPLAKIASGGELSRITLALKSILATADSCETLIFDEIDSGIGGITAHAVGEKLWAISQSQQVICVTHSAAIAARANQHLLLEKQENQGRTQTSIKSLNHQERALELARMLGGDSDSQELLSHAHSLLKR